jgi:hypothetical protein
MGDVELGKAMEGVRDGRRSGRGVSGVRPNSSGLWGDGIRRFRRGLRRPGRRVANPPQVTNRLPTSPTKQQSRNQSTEPEVEKVFRPVSGLAVPLPVPSAYALGYGLSSCGLEPPKSLWPAEKLMDCNTNPQTYWPQRSITACASQFSDGRSMWSMTMTSTGPLVDSSFKPIC